VQEDIYSDFRWRSNIQC